ncbi:MAG: hypothetical protein P4M11_14405 [Candidatus Pacebacteria bacterium]|nr:hypothetical protein [Candidatus Paceibacterota bacterium]
MYDDVLNKTISLFKEKYRFFKTRVTLLENVIKVSLLPDPDKELCHSSIAITHCAKCKTGLLEIRPFTKNPILVCNKCGKQIVFTVEADHMERVDQRCHVCERYMVHVIKGKTSMGLMCTICNLESVQKAKEKLKAQRRKGTSESGKEEEKGKSEAKKESGKKEQAKKEQSKKEEAKKKKKKKSKKKKPVVVPLIANPSKEFVQAQAAAAEAKEEDEDDDDSDASES